VLKRQIDSEDHFGTQSPKFQVLSTGGRVFQVDDLVTIYLASTTCSLQLLIAYVLCFDVVNAIFLVHDIEIVIVLTWIYLVLKIDS